MHSAHHLLHLERHARHGVDDLVDPAGGRPGSAGRARCRAARQRCAPSGTSAWRRLLAGMSRPRLPNMARIRSTTSASRTRSTPITSAMRVAGDVVLGRPEPAAHDHRVGAVERDAAARRPCGRGCRRPWIWIVDCRSRPAPAARRSTTSWCRRSDRAAARSRWRRLRTHAASGHGLIGPWSVVLVAARPSTRYWTPVTTVSTTATHSSAVRTATAILGGPAATAQPTANAWTKVLYFAGLAWPASPGPGAAQWTRNTLMPDLADDDDGDRHPPERPDRPRADQPAEDEDLVGQRIEEGAGPGGALAAGDAAVEAVGRRQHEPQGERGPRRRLVGDRARRQTGDSQQAADGDDVGRRGEGRRPEGGRCRSRVIRSASIRSGPRASVTSTVCERSDRERRRAPR